VALKKISLDILIDENVTSKFVLDSIVNGLKDRSHISDAGFIYSFKKMDAVYYGIEDKFVCPVTLNMEKIDEQNSKKNSQ